MTDDRPPLPHEAGNASRDGGPSGATDGHVSGSPDDVPTSTPGAANDPVSASPPVPSRPGPVQGAGIATRSGFVALAGRPNAGKSTLTNGLIGAKVAITSDKPQTTRRAIRGVLTRPDVQIVLVDLPGVQRPRDSLTGRMQRRVEVEVREADVALMVVNGEQGIGPGDRFVAAQLASLHVPVVMAVNKVDRLDRAGTVAALLAAAELDVAEDVFPISARTGAGVEQLREHLVQLLPSGPFYYPVDEHSDQPRHVLLAELVREQVLRRTFQEIPHAVEVAVEEIERPSDDLHVIVANAWVESDSQKGILIGAGGRMIRAIGTAARRELERELGTRVHLDLQVKVRRNWRSDDTLLDRLEID